MAVTSIELVKQALNNNFSPSQEHDAGPFFAKVPVASTVAASSIVSRSSVVTTSFCLIGSAASGIPTTQPLINSSKVAGLGESYLLQVRLDFCDGKCEVVVTFPSSSQGRSSRSSGSKPCSPKGNESNWITPE